MNEPIQCYVDDTEVTLDSRSICGDLHENFDLLVIFFPLTLTFIGLGLLSLSIGSCSQTRGWVVFGYTFTLIASAIGCILFIISSIGLGLDNDVWNIPMYVASFVIGIICLLVLILAGLLHSGAISSKIFQRFRMYISSPQRFNVEGNL